VSGQVSHPYKTYEGSSKSFRTGCPERELQMVQLSATRCSFIAILWASLVSFAAIILCVASQCFFFCCCCCECIFHYRLSPETFGYTLVCGITRWQCVTCISTVCTEPGSTDLCLSLSPPPRISGWPDLVQMSVCSSTYCERRRVPTYTWSSYSPAHN
jgi:hypothetical protein